MNEQNMELFKRTLILRGALILFKESVRDRYEDENRATENGMWYTITDIFYEASHRVTLVLETAFLENEPDDMRLRNKPRPKWVEVDLEDIRLGNILGIEPDRKLWLRNRKLLGADLLCWGRSTL
jgi:hypothetical protein